MKKFIIIISSVILALLGIDYAYYHMGIWFDFDNNENVEFFTKTDEDNIYIRKNDKWEEFEVKGVNMGSGTPGKWSTEFAIDKETYKRWFAEIQEMGANTLRIYTIQNDMFYDAFYEYNEGREEPLYLIHGVWVNDYVQNSHKDAYDRDFYDTFLSDAKTMIDVVHGNKKINLGRVGSAGHGTYKNDISDWVIGYILGVEWEDLTVAYTDDLYKNDADKNSYNGRYMYTAEGASPFEAMLARVGDGVIEYESKRYEEQRIVAFSNWPTTDPFEYPQKITDFFMKCAEVDVENIKCTEEFLPGQFASYHVYPYYPDYLAYSGEWSEVGINNLYDFFDGENLNTYRAYLSLLTKHHTMPVVISEFGVSTGRGMAQRDINTNRNQGNMSEREQGQAIIDCWDDIKSVGCAGGCIFTWQDEWFKRTWNTMYAVDLTRTPYWSDYQTNEQYFGLLSFDTGNEKSVCYVDGDVSEWTDENIISKNDNTTLSAMYDEKFIYFLVNKKGLNIDEDKIYIPIDTTQKSGSTYCENFNLKFGRGADFVIAIDGKDNSRVMVQEYYEALRSTYSQNTDNFDTYSKKNIPEKTSPKFVNIDMILQTATALVKNDLTATAEVYETGKLTYGNANPESNDFNSLADFCAKGDYIEIKLPWQLLNFADPSQMRIHDDYYSGNYGIEHIKIDRMYLGVCDGENNERIPFETLTLTGWGNKPTHHERLKTSYYMVQNMWMK